MFSSFTLMLYCGLVSRQEYYMGTWRAIFSHRNRLGLIEATMSYKRERIPIYLVAEKDSGAFRDLGN